MSAAPLPARSGARKQRIALLFHARTSDRELRKAVVSQMVPLWREAGYEVVLLRGTKRRVPADLIFVHVDLSVVPDEYLEFAARYPIAVNGLARDIRKSTISRHRVRPGDGWDGPVIAKSDLNCAGRPERRAGLRWRLWDGIRPGRQDSPFRSWRNYEIFDAPGRVPPPYFEDSRIVVERFLPEIEAGLYRLRMYQFLGDRTTCIRMASPEPLVKGARCVEIDRVESHPQLEVWRRELHLDYGKLDYVLHQGEPVLLDANKTTGRVLASTPDLLERRRYRAEGIDWFFRHEGPDAVSRGGSPAAERT